MAPEPRGWTFLTNHAAVLIAIARDSDLRIRDIAAQVGITERAAHSILSDLCEGGYVTIKKEGRRNTYEVHPHIAMRHPITHEHEIGEIVDVLGKRS